MREVKFGALSTEVWLGYYELIQDNKIIRRITSKRICLTKTEALKDAKNVWINGNGPVQAKEGAI